MPIDTASAAPPDEAFRLPRTAEPHAYRLELEPDLAAATFTGSVAIDLTVHEPTDVLVCHAAELDFDGATVVVGGRELEATVALDPAAERATFAVGAPLPAGPATLRCRFAGVLNDRLRGFYRSTFVDADGVTRTIATTQMEATDARRAFPCWDEPDRKATFEIALVVDEGSAAFSNSPVAAEEPAGPGRRRVRFAPTMKMSTYLVAFVVGPFEATEPVDVDGVPVRVVTVPGKGHLAPFALDVAAHALRFFAEYFAIPYPADKLDLLAIPDFAFGAMENLGCVTFRETALLADPAEAARAELERVADVVAHELAHMWFGDLVTMRWWEGIWLNEAFATFMETLCVDAYRPSWHRWLTFGISREAALAIDGLHATRPIEYAVGSPEEADGMFDVLTYEKGASVLRMLEQYLGPDTFRQGIRLYLRRHAYANTVTTDLWRALEEASGQPVQAIMDTWILQGGHPTVTLADGTLHQEPFAFGPPPPGDDSAIGSRWQVPVFVRWLDGDGAGGVRRLLLAGDEMPLRDPPAGDPPAVVNAGGWGVYRSSYPPDQLAVLGRRLGDLAPLERSLLFADTWASVMAGQRDLTGYVDLVAALGQEEEPTTWSSAAGALGLCWRVARPEDRETVAAATRALLGPRFDAVGWEAAEGEDERTPSLRATLLRTLGVVGADEAVRREAARRFDLATGGGPAISPDIQAAVLDVVADQLRPGDYETVLARYRAPSTPQDELRHLQALASFPDVDLDLRTFDLALTEARSQDGPYLVLRLLAQPLGGPTMWEQLVARWDEALGRFPSNSHCRMLEGVATLCHDAELAASVRAFLLEHPVAVGPRRVTQSLERLTYNLAFAERYRGRLGAILGAVPGVGSR